MSMKNSQCEMICVKLIEYLKKISRNRYVQNVLSMAGGAAIAQLAFVFATPLLTRLYPPASYGHFANIMAVSAIYAPIASLRYDFLYYKCKDKMDKYFSASIFSILLTLPTFYLIIGHSYADAFQSYNDKLLLLLICSSGLLNLTSQFLIGSLQYVVFSRTKAFQGLVQVLLSLFLGYEGCSTGLVWALLCAQLVTVSLQYKVLVADNNRIFTIKGGLSIVVQRYRLALISTITTLLQYSAPLAPILISMRYFTKEQSGIYFFCAQLFSLPLSLFRRSLLNIITSEFSDLHKAKRSMKHIYNNTRGYYPLFVLLIALIIIPLYFYGNLLFGFLFGKQWTAAGSISWIVLLMFIVDMFCQPISNMLTLWNSEFKNLLIELVRFNGVFTLPMYLLHTYNISFNQYVYLHCTIMVVVYFLSSFVTLRKMALHAAA